MLLLMHDSFLCPSYIVFLSTNRLREDQAMCVISLIYWTNGDHIISVQNHERENEAWNKTPGLPDVPADVADMKIAGKTLQTETEGIRLTEGFNSEHVHLHHRHG